MRECRASGIVVFYNILIKDDSGQAGMTSKEGCPTFYECIIFRYLFSLRLRDFAVMLCFFNCLYPLVPWISNAKM
jgi:hypothetical protein